MFIVILIILVLLILLQYLNVKEERVYTEHECHEEGYNTCKTPDLTSEECYLNEYQNSSYQMNGPSKLGNKDGYSQVTNNNLDIPNNLKCDCRNSRSYEVCPYKDKVSQTCYGSKTLKCFKKNKIRNYDKMFE